MTVANHGQHGSRRSWANTGQAHELFGSGVLAGDLCNVSVVLLNALVQPRYFAEQISNNRVDPSRQVL